MFDADSIKKRIKSCLNNEANKIDGSFAADNVGAVAQELEIFYSFAHYLDANHYVSTAEGEYLDKKAQDYGLKRKSASKAVGTIKITGTDGVLIPEGSVFLSDTLSFVTTAEGIIIDGFVTVNAEAEAPGIASNVPIGAITKLETEIQGITEIKNEIPFIGGTENESDRSFRERLLFKIQNPATSGNVNHYKIWASEVNGVGKVRIFPLWSGAGTVKVSILDDNSEVASTELIGSVKQYLDPGDGSGTGKAPIGALITVATASKKNISVTAALTLVNSEQLESTKNAIKEAIKSYFKEISYNEKINYVSYAKIVDILFDNPNVEDFENLKINNDVKNIPLGQEEIPFLSSLEVS